MNRRELTKLLGTGLLASAITPRIALAATPPQVAITMDDFNLHGADEQTAEKRNQAILSAFRSHSVKAAIFVAGKCIDSDPGQRLLKQWNDDGHIIANHTYSHRNYADSDFSVYTADMLRCEALIKDYRQFRRLFRFPFLREGNTAEQRDRMRSFLADQKYKNGAVTIDASDWYIDERLRKRLTTDSNADTTGYRDYYLQHIRDRSTYYDDLSRRSLNRSVKHTLLVHHNVLNELYLGDILDQYKRHGWDLIDAEHAYTDPIFSEKPDVLPAGDSLVLALAIQNGKTKRPRYPSEAGEYEAPNMDRLGL
ncbi:MAG TPA: polysaccharide deacetylase family protein [Steroidobacteraceae bacterium]|nr:polysaccharide deacetylase family protein [Steroidobacteraceae bacterium]